MEQKTDRCLSAQYKQNTAPQVSKPEKTPEEIERHAHWTASRVREELDHLLDLASSKGVVREPEDLLNEMENEARDSQKRVPKISQQWISNMRIELKQPGRFSPVEEVAVLQYVREAYREAYLDQKDAVQNGLTPEEEDDLRSKAVEQAFVSRLSLSHSAALPCA